MFGEEHERTIVLFADYLSKNALKHTENGQKILSCKSLRIVDLKEKGEFKKEFRVKNNSNLLDKTMMVLSPFDAESKTYITSHELELHITQTKFACLLKLCQYLGAKKIDIVNVVIDSNGTNFEFGLTDIKGQPANSNKKEGQGDKSKGSWKNTIFSLFKENTKLNAKLEAGWGASFFKSVNKTYIYEGGLPNYNGAKKFLEKNNLQDDIELVELLEFFEPEVYEGNKIRNFNKNFTLLDRKYITLNLASSLELFDVTLGNLNASYNKEKLEMIAFELDIEF